MIYDDSYKTEQGAHFAVAETLYNGPRPYLHTPLHYHSDMELIFVDQGETVMQIGGREVKAGPGSLLLINPYQVHTGETPGGNYAHRCICFDLTQLDLPCCVDILSAQMGYANLIAETDGIKSYFSGCYDAVKNRSAGWEMRARGNLLVLFSMLTDQIRSTVPTKAQTFSKAVLDYIEEHFPEEITSKEMAARLSYDHSYFCRKFKRIFSQNFCDFLSGYRIRKATELLKTHSVSHTATACGFQSISYFSKIFKKLTGETPGSYRKTVSRQ